MSLAAAPGPGNPLRGAVLVTGASSGIGRACALHLDGLGFRVLAGVRRAAAGEALRREASGRLTPLVLDVTDAASIRSAADAVRAAVDALGLAGLGGLVNNAGITVPGPLELLPLDDLRRQLEVNVVGQVAVTQAVLPLLRTRAPEPPPFGGWAPRHPTPAPRWARESAGRGRVVNVGSLSGQVALPFYGAYAASKFALEALTDALRVELRPWRIHVSLVEPGAVATPIWDKALAEADAWLQRVPPEVRARAQALYGPAMFGVRANARRLAAAARPASDVARAVGHALTAARPRARYRVGQTIHSRLLLALAHLPPWLRDAIIARALPRYPARA